MWEPHVLNDQRVASLPLPWAVCFHDPLEIDNKWDESKNEVSKYRTLRGFTEGVRTRLGLGLWLPIVVLSMAIAELPTRSNAPEHPYLILRQLAFLYLLSLFVPRYYILPLSFLPLWRLKLNVLARYAPVSCPNKQFKRLNAKRSCSLRRYQPRWFWESLQGSHHRSTRWCLGIQPRIQRTRVQHSIYLIYSVPSFITTFPSSRMKNKLGSLMLTRIWSRPKPVDFV